jgi:hypothetical protein
VGYHDLQRGSNEEPARCKHHRNRSPFNDNRVIPLRKRGVYVSIGGPVLTCFKPHRWPQASNAEGLLNASGSLGVIHRAYPL